MQKLLQMFLLMWQSNIIISNNRIGKIDSSPTGSFEHILDETIGSVCANMKTGKTCFCYIASNRFFVCNNDNKNLFNNACIVSEKLLPPAIIGYNVRLLFLLLSIIIPLSSVFLT